MSDSEVILSILFVTVALGLVAILLAYWCMRLNEKLNSAESLMGSRIAKVKTDLTSDMINIKEGLGYNKKTKFVFPSYHTSYLIPEHSVYERINLLMDHLNLEIKKGEPTETKLVKKKPINRGNIKKGK